MARRKSNKEESPEISPEISEEPISMVEEVKEPPQTGRIKFRKSWRELSPVQKTLNIVMGVVEIVLVSLALRDIARRPGSEINGKKRTWVLTSMIQPIGPIIYFAFGRKKSKGPAEATLIPA